MHASEQCSAFRIRIEGSNQLFFQHSSRLNEEATVNGLVGHANALVIRIWIFSHPEICSGDQSCISLLATIFCNFTWMARRHDFGRKANSQAWDGLQGCPQASFPLSSMDEAYSLPGPLLCASLN